MVSRPRLSGPFILSMLLVILDCMIDDVTKTQQDLHPTINHQAGIYTPGELLTKTDEGKGGLANKSIFGVLFCFYVHCTCHVYVAKS